MAAIGQYLEYDPQLLLILQTVVNEFTEVDITRLVGVRPTDETLDKANPIYQGETLFKRVTKLILQ